MTGFNGFPTKSGAGGGGGVTAAEILNDWPTPIPVSGSFFNEAYSVDQTSNLALYWPLTPPDGDGRYIQFPTSVSANLFIKAAGGATLYTITETDIAAAMTNWLAAFLDPDDGLIYVLLSNGTTSVAIGTIDPTTGATAQLGSTDTVVPTLAGSEVFCLYRQTPGGNFTFNTFSGSTSYLYTIDVSTGTWTEETVPSYNGVDVPFSASPYYADGAYVATFNLSSTPGNLSLVNLYRGGMGRISANGSMFLGAPNGNNNGLYAYNWGGYVGIGRMPFSGSGGNLGWPRFFEKASFDAWINAICDALGMPDA